jgi:hypothetical protein
LLWRLNVCSKFLWSLDSLHIFVSR